MAPGETVVEFALSKRLERSTSERLARKNGLAPFSLQCAPMNRFCSAPVWAIFKKKLSAQYPHLTESDFAVVERDEHKVLLHLRLAARCSCIDLARLVDEATESCALRQLLRAPTLHD